MLLRLIKLRKFNATLSLLRILEALPLISTITLPLFTFRPSLVLASKLIFLSVVLKVSFTKFRPPTIQFSPALF